MSRLKTFIIALAAIGILSGSVSAAVTVTENGQIITDKIEALLSQGMSLEDAAKAVTNELADAINIEKNSDVMADIYMAVAKAAENNGIGAGTDSFSSAIGAISALLINSFGASEGEVIDAALAGNIDLATILGTLPATAAGETGPAQQASPVAFEAASTGIMTSNSARGGGSSLAI